MLNPSLGRKSYLSHSCMAILHQIEWVTGRKTGKEMPIIFSWCGHHIWFGCIAPNANTNVPLICMWVFSFTEGGVEEPFQIPKWSWSRVWHLLGLRAVVRGPRWLGVWSLGSFWGNKITCKYFISIESNLENTAIQFCRKPFHWYLSQRRLWGIERTLGLE